MRNYFPRLLGNSETKERVGRAIENRTVPHAFLIGGPSGSGKTTLAIEMAAAINCLCSDDKNENLPCGKCNFCRRIYDGNFPDLKTLAKPKDKAMLGVEAVKDFREDMFLSSTEAEHKVYIIDDAESMTPEAQNALLKVLEEPPRSVTIILLAKECDRILTTIKSRVQYISMTRFSDEQLTDILIKENSEARVLSSLDNERLQGIIMSSDGRLGTAKKLLGRKNADENEEDRSCIMKIISSLGSKTSYSNIYSAITSLPTTRSELCNSLELLVSAIRDLVLLKYKSDAKMVFFTSHEAAKKIGGDIAVLRLISVYDSVNEALEYCYKNANTQNLLINLSARIKSAIIR